VGGFFALACCLLSLCFIFLVFVFLPLGFGRFCVSLVCVELPWVWCLCCAGLVFVSPPVFLCYVDPLVCFLFLCRCFVCSFCFVLVPSAGAVVFLLVGLLLCVLGGESTWSVGLWGLVVGLVVGALLVVLLL